MTGCLNMYMCTSRGFRSAPGQPSGLDLNHLDERERLVALCCGHEWFTGQRRRKRNLKSSYELRWGFFEFCCEQNPGLVWGGEEGTAHLYTISGLLLDSGGGSFPCRKYSMWSCISRFCRQKKERWPEQMRPPYAFSTLIQTLWFCSHVKFTS